MQDQFEIKAYESFILKVTLLIQASYQSKITLFFRGKLDFSYTPKINLNFLSSASSKKTHKDLNSSYYEFRFLIQPNLEIKTKNKKLFFSKIKPIKDKPSLFLCPYYHFLDENPISEDFIQYSFAQEIKIKIFKSRLHIDFFINSDEKKVVKEQIKCLYRNQKNQPSSSQNNTQKNKTNKNFSLKISEKSILNSIHLIQKNMQKGNCYLANITTTKKIPSYDFLDFEKFIHNWFKKTPRFGIYFQTENHGIACFSPERFILKKEDKIISQPIKGTKKIDHRKDNYLQCENLWKNRKERFEHTLVVDLIRNDFNTICLPGSVQVENAFEIMTTQGVLQMQSSIVGQITPSVTIGQLLEGLLPVGSITGTPKKKVCELLKKFEKKERGYYTGVCGIIEPNGDMDSCVLIRSYFKGNLGHYVGVGAGITTLSQAQNELDEFYLKLKSFLH